MTKGVRGLRSRFVKDLQRARGLRDFSRISQGFLRDISRKTTSIYDAQGSSQTQNSNSNCSGKVFFDITLFSLDFPSVRDSGVGVFGGSKLNVLGIKHSRSHNEEFKLRYNL